MPNNVVWDQGAVDKFECLRTTRSNFRHRLVPVATQVPRVEVVAAASQTEPVGDPQEVEAGAVNCQEAVNLPEGLETAAVVPCPGEAAKPNAPEKDDLSIELSETCAQEAVVPDRAVPQFGATDIRERQKAAKKLALAASSPVKESVGALDYTSSPASDVSISDSNPTVSPIQPPVRSLVSLAENSASADVSLASVEASLPVGAPAGPVLDRSLPPDGLVFPRVRAKKVELKLALEKAYLEVLLRGCVDKGLVPEQELNYFAPPGQDSLSFIQETIQAQMAADDSLEDTVNSFYSFLYPHVSLLLIIKVSNFFSLNHFVFV